MSNVITKVQKQEIMVKLLTAMLAPAGKEIAERSKDLEKRWAKFNEERVLAEYPFLTLEQGKILRQKHAGVMLTGAVTIKREKGTSYVLPGHGEFYSQQKDRKRDGTAYDALKASMQGTSLTTKFVGRHSRYNETVKWYQDQDYPYLLHVRTLQIPLYLFEQGEWPADELEMLDWARKAIGLVLESEQLGTDVGALYEKGRAAFEEIEPILNSITTFSKLEELFPEAAKVCPDKPEKVKAVLDIEQINKVRERLKAKPNAKAKAK